MDFAACRRIGTALTLVLLLGDVITAGSEEPNAEQPAAAQTQPPVTAPTGTPASPAHPRGPVSVGPGQQNPNASDASSRKRKKKIRRKKENADETRAEKRERIRTDPAQRKLIRQRRGRID